MTPSWKLSHTCDSKYVHSLFLLTLSLGRCLPLDPSTSYICAVLGLLRGQALGEATYTGGFSPKRMVPLISHVYVSCRSVAREAYHDTTPP